MTAKTYEKIGDRELFKEEIKRRLTEPSQHMTFLSYFILAIFICSAIGFWIPFFVMIRYGAGEKYEYFLSFSQSLTTYALAISATAFVDLILSMNNAEEVAKKPLKNPITFFAIIAFIVVLLLTLWTFTSIPLWLSFSGALLGTLLSWLIWWIANGDNSKLLETKPPSDAATGGDTKYIKGDEKALSEGLG
jgi:magnesium-transporting ATPase (P-type)